MDAAVPDSRRLRRSFSDFEAFYLDRRDDLCRTLAVSLRDVELARDATDEAMVRAFARWRRVKGMGNPSGWVYRVAFNWATDQLRKANNTRDETVSLEAGLPTPRPDLAVALDALPVDQRAVIVLRVVHDWSEEDVAYALDIPVGTVKSRLSRGLEKLRNEVDDEY